MVGAAVGLFEDPGFESTSVAEIAAAVGVSRATFFRQVGTKEDAIFADHPQLLEDVERSISERLADDDADPWGAVCAASLEVFDHLTHDLATARRRYRVVRQAPALRDREIVTERRYEQVFDRALRRALPGVDSLDTVCFAAAITAAHNHELRALLRAPSPGADPGAEPAGPGATVEEDSLAARDRLQRAVGGLRERLAPGAPGASGADRATDASAPVAGSAVVVASFPAGMDPDDVARRVREALS